MNDKAREVLVAAALNGVEQVRGTFGAGDARCAMGVLGESLGLLKRSPWNYITFDQKPIPSWEMFSLDIEKICKEFDITQKELFEIMNANDDKGWDFLQIARKCCNGPESTTEA